MTALAAKIQRHALRRFVVSPWALALGAAGIGGIALRVWVYKSVLSVPDSDEGLVGLVARHIARGHFSIFIWGLHYGGVQELIATAPIFWAFGSSWLALRIVPWVLVAVTSLLIWRIGRRTFGARAGAFAAALFWVWPPYNLEQLGHQHGYYASDVFYTALLILLALRVKEEASTLRVAIFGLVLGLGFYQTSHLVPVEAGVVAWTIWQKPQALRKLWIALPLAVLGMSPWILWNIHHDWAALNISYDAHSTYFHRLRIFLSPLLPMIIGFREYGTQTRVLPAALTYLLLFVLAGLFAYGAFRNRRGNTSIIYFVAILFPFVYAISEWTIESSDPRYLVVYTPILALLFGQLATSLLRGSALVALGALVSVVVLHHHIADNPPLVDPPRSFSPLIATLDRLDVHYIYSSYWVAYRLAFETKERIIGVKNDWGGVSWDGTQAQPTLGSYIRYPPYERAVRDHIHAFVFYRDAVPTIASQLTKYGYKHYDVSTLVVYALPHAGTT